MDNEHVQKLLLVPIQQQDVN